MQPRVLLDGLAMPESPRWHEGRLWFSNWGTRQIIAVDLDGNGDVVGEGPDGLGWATNWLPDGRLLVTGPELIRVEPDGSRVRHADLSPWGAEICSCSSPVLVQETTEQVMSVHPILVSLGSDAKIGGWTWGFQPERPMLTMPVVMLHVDS